MARPDILDALAVERHTLAGPHLLDPCPHSFGDVRLAPPEGLVARGGDFRPATIIQAYRSGVFPWPQRGKELLWFSPDPRATIPLDGLHVSRRLERTLRQGAFRLTVDAAFDAVINECARGRPEGTWITRRLRDAYQELHRLGYAHSFEAWAADGELAGGLYGIAIGAMFGAESMFHRVTDASKAAMVGMVSHGRRIGIELLDIQVLSAHTASMGAVEISRDEYLDRLTVALSHGVAW